MKQAPLSITVFFVSAAALAVPEAHAAPRHHGKTAKKASPGHYLVLPGDTLIGVAHRFGLDAVDLCRANRGVVAVQPGEVLAIPGAPDALARRKVVLEVEPGDTVESLAQRFDLTPAQLRWINRLAAGEQPAPGTTLLVYAPVRHIRRGFDPSGRAFYSHIREPTLLPDGPGYVRKHPHTAWGTRQTVDTLRAILAQVHRRFPHAPPLVVGDLSRKWGGRFRPHVSHKWGNDVDIGIPLTVDAPTDRFTRARPSTMDMARTWELIRAAIATGRVEFVFLDWRLQRALRAWVEEHTELTKEQLDVIFQAPRRRWHRVGIVRHEHGHRDHLHIRFKHERLDISPELIAALGGSPPPTPAQVEGRCAVLAIPEFFGAN